MKKLMALMALMMLTACDYADRSDFDRERSDRLYKSAMDDYRAGRIDAALGGFTDVIRKDPSNASARFQLACLLQDAKSDYLGAFCGYREYLLQHPESDKARLAGERLAKCELELAKFLAAKYGLAEKDGLLKENEALKVDLRAAETRVATSEKEAESLRARVTALGAERDRLLAIIKGGDPSGAKPAALVSLAKEAKALLEEDETDRIKMSEDVSALRAEESEDLASGSELLPTRRQVTNVTVRAVEPSRPVVEARKIPETYVVQEGDTLYGISKRFYGRLSAWKRIRNMNKELISSDNRLHVGDTLRLPPQ